ncbi:MAG: site-specific integrase [Oscillospiraceae bacterium]|nr:site-specific integrase [Oscillospiraceae bacterium]
MTGHIRKRENKTGTTWQIIIDKGEDPKTGKRNRESITIKGTKKEAEIILNEKLTEYNRGTYIERSKLTVGQHLADWMKTYAEPSLAPNTVRGYKVNIDKHTLPHIGNIELQKLTPVQVQDMYKKLEAGGLCPRSVQYVHATLRKALDRAYKMRLVSLNAAEFASPPKQIKPKVEVYNQTEVQTLLGAAKGTDMEVPVNLVVSLGLRRGEVLALKWEDVDFAKGTVAINRSLSNVGGETFFDTPKTAAGIRALSLPEALIALLKAHKGRQAEPKLLLGEGYENNDLVCCRLDGQMINPGSFSHAFSDFLERSKLRHIRFHDLRHTNATLMLQYGVPAKVASARLGHANIKITLDTYTHVLPEMQQDAADKLNEGIYGVGGA